MSDHPKRVIIVGGGILGMMHAVVALRAGHFVTQLERDEEPRGASVRNFGLLWISGRRTGRELDLALSARRAWESLGAVVAGIGFRANGSITLARSDEEMAVLEEAAARPDAPARGFSLLQRESVRAANPALSGAFVGGLFCERDGTVEPRLSLRALREYCEAFERYHFLRGCRGVALRPGGVADEGGTWHEGDLVVCCAGASPGPLLTEALEEAPLRRVRLQMLETDAFDGVLTTSLADGDSLRYYPGFAGEAVRALAPPGRVAARWHAQLLVVQRLDGGLTIGDTHDYHEPFPFDLDEEASNYLLGAASDLLGSRLPSVRRRWSGIYAEATDSEVYYRAELDKDVVVVTGAGGRGMTLAPAIAEETFSSQI